MKKPRLTAKIVRGLDAVYALADVNLFEDSDLFAGAKTTKDQKEILDAVAWLGDLINWHQAKASKRKGGEDATR